MRILVPNSVIATIRALGIGQPGKGCVRVMAMWEPGQGPAGGRLLPQDAFWETVGAQSGDFDEGLPKARGEFLVSGSAFSKEPVTDIGVQAAIGPLKKTLHVFGERFWSGSAASRPVPFTEMPITWERAFGGPNDANNYAGRGQVEDEKIGAVLLPNIEWPAQLVTSPRDRPPPAGFGPRMAAGLPRRNWLGTMDELWVARRFPEMPQDFNPLFGQSAPEDQWIAGFWKGDEPYCLINLHPLHPRWEGQLPNLCARAWARRMGSTAGQGAPQEVKLALDTVWFFPRFGRIALIWRGKCDLPDDDELGLREIMAALEWRGQPRSNEHYAEAFKRRTEKQPEGSPPEHDSELLPIELAPPMPAPAIEEPPPPPPDLDKFFDDMKAELEADLAPVRKEMEKTRAEIAKAGAPTEQLDKAIADLDAAKMVEEMKKAAKAPPKSVEEEIAEVSASFSEVREKMVEAGAGEEQIAQLDDAELELKMALAKLDEGIPEQVGPPELPTAEEQIDILAMLKNIKNEIAKDVAAAGVDVQYPFDIEAQIAQLEIPEFQQDLEAEEEEVRERYRQAAHVQLACNPIGAQASARRRAEVLAAVAAGKSLARWDLTGVDLSGISLRGADLSGAWLESAILRGADLSNCKLARAVLTRADLGGAVLKDADLTDANIAGAGFQQADCSRVSMAGAICLGADFSRARLEEVNLSAADIGDCKFAGASLKRATARGLSMDGADWSECDFSGADVSEGSFTDCQFNKSVFRGAKLERTLFFNCNGDGADFSEAQAFNIRFGKSEDGQSSFRRASFKGAALTRACLGDTELAGADFRRATASGAVFSNSDLTRARFDAAILRGAKFDRAVVREASFIAADLMDGDFMRARAAGANFQHANLFGVNTLRMRTDGRTNFAEANLDSVRFIQPVKEDATSRG